jgi:adenylyltransferase/sulfurtransferase
LALQIPFIYGGINGWNGMAATFLPGRTACFACLFPPGQAMRKEEIPVLGPAAGVIAAIQSLEVIKILLGLPSRLAGRMLRFRGLEMRFQNTRIDKNPQCPVWGRHKGG